MEVGETMNRGTEKARTLGGWRGDDPHPYLRPGENSTRHAQPAEPRSLPHNLENGSQSLGVNCPCSKD